MRCILLVAAAVSLVACSSAKQAEWTVAEPTYDSVNHTLTGKSIETIDRVFLPSLCAQLCIKDDRCKSFNFNYGKAECMINDATDEDPTASLVEEMGSVYYRRADFQVDPDVLGLCKSNPCQNHGRCIESCGQNGQRRFECICVDSNWKGDRCEMKAETPQWGSWSDGGPCSVTCGEGVKVKQRMCEDPETGGVRSSHDCYGADVMFDSCNAGPCPQFSIWSVWSSCVHEKGTCEPGVATRSRTCLNNGVVDQDLRCTGPVQDMKPCRPLPCDVTLRIVGDGSRKRRSAGSRVGNGHVEVFQNNVFRPICGDGFDLNDAKVICRQMGFVDAASFSSGGSNGDSFGIKNVDCDGSENSMSSCGYTTMGPSETCSNGLAKVECKVDGGWGNWGTWSGCSVTCGEGTQNRQRNCNHPEPENGGAQCAGSGSEERVCTQVPCPIDGYYENWGTWGACSKVCGGGEEERSRVCVPPQHGGGACVGDDKEARACNTAACPVDGQWNAWQAWGQCSMECGGGSQDRVRTCERGNAAGKDCEGPTLETRDCNLDPCPIDGVWKAWENWQDCNVTCGDYGVKKRTRSCEGPLYGGQPCQGKSVDEAECDALAPCPINGVWKAWSSYVACSLSCGGGKQTRSRVCDGPYNGGIGCEGEEIEERLCNTNPCPIDGVWNEWEDWGSCSVTCGDGVIERTRTCNGPFNGGTPCDENNSSEQKACNDSPCPVDGNWLAWGDWTTCNNGQQTRTRECTKVSNGGVNHCENESDGTETRPCS